MKIIIALEHDNDIIGAVAVEDERLAVAYFQGRNEYPHHYDSIECGTLTNHPTGVIPIVATRKTTIVENGEYTHNQRILDNVRL